MGFTVFMNIVGALFATTGIVLYAVDLENAYFLWMCDGRKYNVGPYGDNCRNVALLAQVRVQLHFNTFKIRNVSSLLP